MRQSQFILIAFFTSLLVPNAAFLRLDNFSNQSEIANAATSTATQMDLNGGWIWKAPKFKVSQTSCTLSPEATLTVDDQNLDQDKGFVTTFVQEGDQLPYSEQVVTYPGGSYKQHTQGKVSGSHFESTTSSFISIGQLTLVSTGTISNDGNTILGEMSCQIGTGSPSAKGKLIAKRILPEPGDILTYEVNGDKYAHVAVIVEGGITKNQDGTVTITRVRSKWGGGALYDHDPNQTLSYGKNWSVWRRIKKPKGCNPEKCNWLGTGTCSSILGRNYQGTETCLKTDKDTDIIAGTACFPDSNGNCITTGFTTDEHPLPGVNRVEPDSLSYDCRGFVFGYKKYSIAENLVLVRNQVQKILDDGYVQIHAIDTGTEKKRH